MKGEKVKDQKGYSLVSTTCSPDFQAFQNMSVPRPKPSIHQSEWPIEARAVSESLVLPRDHWTCTLQIHLNCLGSIHPCYNTTHGNIFSHRPCLFCLILQLGGL